MLSPAFLGKFYTNFIDCAMFYNTAVVQILKLEGKWRLRKKVKASAMILKLHFAPVTFVTEFVYFRCV